MPKKNYTVGLTGNCNVLVVGVKNERAAIEAAQQEIVEGDFEITDTEILEEISAADLEDARSNADIISEEGEEYQGN